MSDAREALLARLYDFHVQSILFSGGYLQIAFSSLTSTDRPVLTCEVFPVVEESTGSVDDGDPAYADGLRRLIGQHVRATHEDPDGGLRIEFAGASLRLQPSAEDLRGPVIAMLSDFNDGASTTWRPGGAAFEYLGHQQTDSHGITGGRRPY